MLMRFVMQLTFYKNNSITGQVLAIDSGQSLNWQTPDIIKGKE